MHHDIQLFAEYAVTPFVGVWIETTQLGCYVETVGVTPFVGVWIETRKRRHTSVIFIVTPFVGVWIETTIIFFNNPIRKSHPSWVCGLKLSLFKCIFAVSKSHPSWVCGLKPVSNSFFLTVLRSHPSWVCGLKLSVTALTVSCLSHTLRGCVD